MNIGDRHPFQTSSFILHPSGTWRIVLDAAPHATETLHWGAISYHDAAHGGMVKGPICQISRHRDHIRLSFIHGVRLPDPSC